MNSYNLSVCIGQSLLWTSQSLDGQPQELKQQSESMEKVPKVVQYIMEHLGGLLGDDCMKLFGDAASNKQRGDSSTDSDSMNSILGPSYTQTGEW